MASKYRLANTTSNRSRNGQSCQTVTSACTASVTLRYSRLNHLTPSSSGSTESTVRIAATTSSMVFTSPITPASLTSAPGFAPRTCARGREPSSRDCVCVADLMSRARPVSCRSARRPRCVHTVLMVSVTRTSSRRSSSAAMPLTSLKRRNSSAATPACRIPSNSKTWALPAACSRASRCFHGLELRRLLERPDLAGAARRAGALQDHVDRAPRRLARALHRREVGVGAHVVGGEHEVRDLGRRLGTHRPRARRMDQQARVVRRRRARRVVEVGVEVPRVEQLVAQHALARVRRPLSAALSCSHISWRPPRACTASPACGHECPACPSRRCRPRARRRPRRRRSARGTGRGRARTAAARSSSAPTASRDRTCGRGRAARPRRGSTGCRPSTTPARRHWRCAAARAPDRARPSAA